MNKRFFVFTFLLILMGCRQSSLPPEELIHFFSEDTRYDHESFQPSHAEIHNFEDELLKYLEQKTIAGQGFNRIILKDTVPLEACLKWYKRRYFGRKDQYDNRSIYTEFVFSRCGGTEEWKQISYPHTDNSDCWWSAEWNLKEKSMQILNFEESNHNEKKRDMTQKLKTEILEEINLAVEVGFESLGDIIEGIVEMYEDESELDEEWIEEQVVMLYEKHQEESRKWDHPTDFERLVEVFDQLLAKGVIALHNAGYTRQVAESDCYEMHKRLTTKNIPSIGYCYYHQQDVERAVSEEPNLFIGFGSFDDNVENVRKIGELVAQQLHSNGFDTKWDGSPDQRIVITSINWKKVPSDVSYNYNRVLGIMNRLGTTSKPSLKKKPFWRFW